MDITDWLIKILQPNIQWFTVALTIAGVWCWHLSLRGVPQEASRLRLLKRSRILTEGIIAVTISELDNQRKNTWQFPNHLGLRMKALKKAEEETKSATASEEERTFKSPVFPSLSDMHELTLHNETSRLCATSMNTIISGLLICGILGTLMGVHNVINDIQRDGLRAIHDLPQALQPSMWAVGCTIFLIILRGIYTAAVLRYVSALDRLTLERLLPYYSKKKKPESAHKKKLSTLSDNIAQLKNQTKDLETENKNLQGNKLARLDSIHGTLSAAEEKKSLLTCADLPEPEQVRSALPADETQRQRARELMQCLQNKVRESSLLTSTKS